jgi:ubiquinone/menaquinone biosynthesis C-methylase UbiE
MTPGEGGDGPTCHRCGWRCRIARGVRVFADPEYFAFDKIVEDVTVNLTDPLNWKRMQARHAEQEADDGELRAFERERPYGNGRFYAWMHLREMEMARRLYGASLARKDVLVVCAGRGMDAEFFWRLGAQVTCSDISPSSIALCEERFRARGAQVETVCCDAESLPFADGSFDVCLVYDGLHHLPHPYVALSEMARVAAEGVIIMEPNESPLVRLSRRLGWTTEFEASGNYKHYFVRRELTEYLRARGFITVRTAYRTIKKWHYPNAVIEFLARPGAYHAAVGVLTAVSLAAGRLGNRCIVVGRR